MIAFIRWALALFTVTVIFPCLAAASDRGITIAGAGTLPTATWGTYHALIIGINDYQQWPQLRTAVKDATVLSRVLVDRYGFKKDRVILRTDAAATRRQITADIRALATSMNPDDNLLVYFAGHGQLDDLTGDGYWIPVEGEANNPSSWIANSYLKAVFSSEKVAAKNVVVIADSCYSGAMLRGGPSLMTLDGDYKTKLMQAAARRSRQVISSGGIEPVADGGAEGHSLFAFYFITALKENDREVMDLENLFHTRVWKPVSEIGGQRPSVGRLKTPMDRDGQFVLYNQAWVAQQRRAEENRRREEARRAEEAATRKQKAVAADQMAAIQAERQHMELERQKLEMEKELMAQRQALALDKLKLERERLEMEKEKMASGLPLDQISKSEPLKIASHQPVPVSDPVADTRLPVTLLPVLKEYRNTHWSNANPIKDLMTKGVSEAIRLGKNYELRAIFEEDDAPFFGGLTLIESSEYEKEIASLWKKQSFFDSCKSPQKDIAIDLAKKLHSDLAILLNIWFEPGRIIATLYVVDVRTRAMILKTMDGQSNEAWVEKLKTLTQDALNEIN